jgi:fumarylpyruvate hydrolase
MAYVFEPSAQPSVAVAGTDRQFPVHRIYCVGRNYAAHAVEMGGTGREPPFFFSKPADAVVPVAHNALTRIAFPGSTKDLHHEVELVVAIGKRGANIAAADARNYVWGYAVGLDMTRRDLQQAAKEKRRPWDAGKGFDRSAPIGSIHPVGETGTIDRAAIWLDLNGERRQASDVSRLIWSVEEVIEHLSTLFELQPGDLIFTGTPEGVGPVQPGDRITCGIDGLGELNVQFG